MKDHTNHQKRVSDALDKLPEGTIIKDYILTSIDGDKFWIGKKGGLTSRDFFTEIGHKALIPYIGLKVLGLRE